MKVTVKHLVIFIFIICLSGAVDAIPMLKYDNWSRPGKPNIEVSEYIKGDTQGGGETKSIPEPATLLIFGGGLLFLAGALKKFRE